MILRLVVKLAEDEAAHVVGLEELVQGLVPGGVVQVEILPRNGELLTISESKPPAYIPILYINV